MKKWRYFLTKRQEGRRIDKGALLEKERRGFLLAFSWGWTKLTI
jgi:hypothetical protein